MLRLSLRAPRARAEVCRQRTAEELAALPQHMRTAEVCEEVAPPYRLTVEVDGRVTIDEQFRPRGLRGDRPITVDRQLGLAPGQVRLKIDFGPVEEAGAGEAAVRAAAELPSYGFEGAVSLRPDRVTLFTLDETSGDLEIRVPDP